MPALFHSLKQYSLSKFLSDLMSGVLVAIIALPLSIALGTQSMATLQQGILTSIVAGFIISALGGSNFQIGGPSATFIAVVVSYASIPGVGLLGVQMATVMAGIILIIIGVLRIGKLVKFMPYPIVIGFTAGVGITLLVGQLNDFLGITTDGVGITFTDKMYGIFNALSTINWATLALGIITLLVMIILPRVHKKIPSAFIAIILTTLLAAVLGVAFKGKLNIATIGSTFGSVKAEIYLPDFSAISSLSFSKLFAPAISIAFICAMESLLSARVADGLTNTTTNSNVELVAQGSANIVASLLGGIPAAGVMARTSANIRAGAVSPISGMVHSLVLLLMFFTLMPLVGYIPMTALSAVLIMTAIHMTNAKLYGKLMRFNPKDFLILTTTFLFSVMQNIIMGVVMGLIMTFLLMIPSIVKNTHIVTISMPSNFVIDNARCALDISPVICVDGALTFINSHKLIALCRKTIGNSRYLIINMQQLDSADLTSLEQLAKLERQLEKSGQDLVIMHANPHIQRQFEMSLDL